jgi:hypothetical protein
MQSMLGCEARIATFFIETVISKQFLNRLQTMKKNENLVKEKFKAKNKKQLKSYMHVCTARTLRPEVNYILNENVEGKVFRSTDAIHRFSR